jgi:hypothetical protein
MQANIRDDVACGKAGALVCEADTQKPAEILTAVMAA